jgi:SAM-dependent methyltransferase
MPWDNRLITRVPSLTWQCSPQVKKVVNSFARDSIILDVGAGGRRIAPHVITADFLKLDGTDIVCDVTALPVRDGSVDLLIATGVLEHVVREDEFLQEIRRALKPSGTAYIEIPFLQQYHEDPIDCRRLTLPGLKLLLERYGFDDVEAGFHIGPSVTLATILAHYFALFFEGRTIAHRILSRATFALASVLLFPLKYLDYFLATKPNAHRLAFAVYCRARKIGGAPEWSTRPHATGRVQREREHILG